MSEAVLDTTKVRRWKRRETLQRMPFDWDVTIPADWKIHRLKEVADARPSNVDKKSQEGERSVRLCNYVDVYKNDLISEAIEFMEATATDSQIEQFGIQAGDVIITKDSEAWDDIAVPAYVPKTIKNLVCGYHLTLIRPEAGVLDGAYLARCIQAEGIADQFRVMANGITRYGIGTQGIRCAAIPVPPLSEQRAIAAFLDRETARFDALVAKKQRLIELLEEKRQAIISHAVTNGLDPFVDKVESGINWLGKIPKHWSVKRLKFISPGQSVGLVINPSTYVDPQGEIPFLFGANVLPGRLDLDGVRRITSESNAQIDKSILRAGDLVTVRVGAPGVTAVIPRELDGCNCASVLITRGDAASFCSEWLCYNMNSRVGKSNVAVSVYGAAQEQFNISHAVNFLFPVPPLAEQLEIAAHLRNVENRVDNARARIRESIARLQEHRTALISAAVTGQIDVREEVQLDE